MSWASAFIEETLDRGGRAPLVVRPRADGAEALEDIVMAERDQLNARLVEHGALLFRGFPVATAGDFARFMDGVSPERLNYVYRSTPRTTVEDRIYTATVYPAPLTIPLHNENAYQREYPRKIALCCLKPAAEGGETPIADMRRVTAAIPEAILNRFEQSGVRYIRHYRPGVDLSWQVVFQTDDRAEVGKYCAAQGLDYEWLDADTLRTSQTCQGVVRHPDTGERIFFNQAHLFHVSSLGEKAAKSMIEVFGPDRLPRNACYGDGSAIAERDLAIVRGAFDAAAITFPWQVGDIMLLDNLQVAHGRRPYKGPREVLAALAEACTGETPS